MHPTRHILLCRHSAQRTMHLTRKEPSISTTASGSILLNSLFNKIFKFTWKDSTIRLSIFPILSFVLINHKTIQESYLVWDVLSCMILYLNIFQCIICLEYFLNLWDSVILLKFLKMDGHWWSCLMIFIFETISRLAYPKSENGVVVHVYNGTC